MSRLKEVKRYILCTEDGKETILNYNMVCEFKNGFARVILDGKEGFINETGREIVPIIYDKVYDFENGYARVRLNYKEGFVDKTGKEIIPPVLAY